ncbi:MAG: parallel beta-helix domain-containing protein, partial [Pseudomonadota bacterium]
KPGDVVEIPEGTFAFTRGLSLKANGITIRGAGMNKSILSFKTQAQGAEGLIITGNDITLEGFAVEDAKGDAIKINECENLVIRDIRVEWTNGPDIDNGAYGLYPVQCKNVLIEKSVAIGASDAGIYVGQSTQVIVKNNRAEYNVAGIEIENTTDADVFDNVATNNTGGILVFNMPNLPQPGARTRVFNNQVFANNTTNFAPEGTAVSSVPAGSGVVINSNDEVEIFANQISDNNTANIIISSYFSTGYSDSSTSESFDPYPEAIYIYDNEFKGGGESPDGLDLKALKLAKYGLTGRLPDILWDGFVNKEILAEGKLPQDKAICVQNGEAIMLNVDGPNGFSNLSEDMANHQCELPKLPAVEYPFS